MPLSSLVNFNSFLNLFLKTAPQNGKHRSVRTSPANLIKVQSHFDSKRARREFPLTVVADLIVSSKPAVAPRFATTPTEELTL
ncbi:hypothetical protein HDV02_005565, partial [Globomyces sp. JEL0801]